MRFLRSVRRLPARAYTLTAARELRQLRAAEGLSSEQIRNLQEERLSQLLRHAYHHVPYYHRLLAEVGVLKEDGQVRLERFERIPLLTKHELRSQFALLKSDELDRRSWYYNTSGGSTGEPVRFIQDQEYKRWARAVKLLFDSWTGYRVGLPKVVLWGSERDLFYGREPWNVHLVRWAKNEVWLNAFRMGREDMKHYVAMINWTKPVQILAYSGSMFELARFVEREGLSVHEPRAVLASAGVLAPVMRTQIERTFGAKVFNRYGSREVADVACQCRSGDVLHISPLTHLVEIVDQNGEAVSRGEMGEVVITSLTNFAMPLLRYRIGDLASWSTESCECGLEWHALSEVHGRVNSIIRTPRGSYDSAALSTLLYFKDTEHKEPFRSFSNYQLVQTSASKMVLRVQVADAEAWQAERELVETKLRKAFGEEASVTIEAVDHLLPHPSGKHIYIWSEV